MYREFSQHILHALNLNIVSFLQKFIDIQSNLIHFSKKMVIQELIKYKQINIRYKMIAEQAILPFILKVYYRRFKLYKIIIMGNCSSGSVQIPTIPIETNQLVVSAFSKAQTNTLLNSFRICKEIQNMLNGVAYTSDQATGLAEALIEGIISLEKPPQTHQKQNALKLFTQQNIDLIRKEKLFYFGLIDIRDKNTQIGEVSTQMVYHMIANIKKQQKIQEVKQNKYEINCIKSNDYKILSAQQIKEVVRYQLVGKLIEQLAAKISFRFQSIQKQSEKIVKLLSQCIVKHLNFIKQLKYDLSDHEVMKMAQISRQACDHYDNGVFLLLTYFVSSAKKLQNQNRTSQYIQQKLQSAIQNISNKYPPGEGLSKQHQSLIAMLKDLQDPKNYKKIEFSHEQVRLQSINKQMQVQDMITDYAKIAQRNKTHFQDLVKSTCLQRCVYFKIGLKYYPKNPNKKALTRIKEKMFFKKDQKGKRNLQGTIKDNLQRQQTAYKQSIDQILQKTQAVKFKISDMVRGKCVFLQVSDIIQSVNSIKQFVDKDSRFELNQIQSRFTNKVPISDVTLKIIINKQIVAELQLTIQTNAATYNFAHKIYELQRTKVFSKLKITHNYFEESNEDFSQMATKALKFEKQDSNFKKEDTDQIVKFFELDSFQSSSFRQILQRNLQQKKQSIQNLKITTDPSHQDLMFGVFSIGLGHWYKSLGAIIGPTFQNNNISPKLKSVLLSFFFDSFQLPKESKNMQQFAVLQSQLEKKIYMEEYIKEYFSIQNAFKYARQNYRVFDRALQLKQIIFSYKHFSFPIQLQKSAFVENLIIEQHSFQKIKKLRQLFDFYFITRQQNNSFYFEFSLYYQWLKSQLMQNSSPEALLLMNECSIIKSQQLLQDNFVKQARQLLKASLKAFQSKEDHMKVIDCQILLTQCYIKLTEKLTLEESIKYHDKNVVQKAQTLGLQLKGALYADAIWRTSEFLWNKFTKKEEKKQLLESFVKIALSQMSRCKGTQFVYASYKRWNQFKLNGITPPQIKQNTHLTYAKLARLQSDGCEHLARSKWKNLTSLGLSGNQVGQLGCQYLSQSNWQNLSSLFLQNNEIGDLGCQHLIKPDWKHLTILQLQQNSISDIGCEYLSKSNWKKLHKLILQRNNIGENGCEYLSRADWKNLSILHLGNNKISNKGCEFLSKSQWKNLHSLQLNDNEIESQGCMYLSRSNWSELRHLYLQNNRIEAEGCQYLSQSKWKKLQILHLDACEIGNQGCKFLIQSDWNNFKQLTLNSNMISDEGCQYLIQADWKNLVMLDLSSNQVQDLGCEYLSKSDWKSLETLDLSYNQIGDDGCENLSKRQWSSLIALYLENNKIGDKGSEFLSKVQWTKSITLNLMNNDIHDKLSIKNKFAQKSLQILI